MKPFVVGLVLASTLGLALAASLESEVENKTINAIQECNATNPVRRNPNTVIDFAIQAGVRINITQEEKCFQLCFLQKVNFLNENGDIKNGPRLVNLLTHLSPDLGKYVDQLIARTWQSRRLYKGIEDKCHKAFVHYHEFVNAMFTISIATGLEHNTDLKEEFIHSMETGQPFNPETTKTVEKYLYDYNTRITAIVKIPELQAQQSQ